MDKLCYLLWLILTVEIISMILLMVIIIFMLKKDELPHSIVKKLEEITTKILGWVFLAAVFIFVQLVPIMNNSTVAI